ncbi:MAG: hypothetical protein IKD89_05085 [Clostridia bacterium]|nr:hypothetical protein [Clostridia bacterium]
MKKPPDDIRNDRRYTSTLSSEKHKEADDYITAKTKGHMRWAIPIILLCVIFFIAGLSVTRDYIAEGNPDVPFAIVMDILMFLPIFFIGLIIVRKAAALRYGYALADASEPFIEFSNLDEALHTTRAAAKLKGLSRRGYIRNVEFEDEAQRLILPLNQEHTLEHMMNPINIICPGCGASLQKMPGENVQCDYCGREL